MKTISVDIEEKDWDALQASSEHITYKELKDKMLASEARSSYKKMHDFSEEHGLDKISEDEIFAEVAAIKKEIYTGKHK